MKNNRKQIIIGNNTPNAYSLSLSLARESTNAKTYSEKTING